MSEPRDATDCAPVSASGGTIPGLPVVEELPAATEAVDAFRRLAALPHCVFLDSALRHHVLGRYSFIAADPFEWMVVPADGSDALGMLQARLAIYDCPTQADLPPFQGGAAGLLSYDLGRSLERMPRPRYEEFPVPAVAVGLYDVVLAFDHVRHRSWIISQGYPELDESKRKQRAETRLAMFRRLLTSTADLSIRQADGKRIEQIRLAPQYPAGNTPGLTSDFSATQYRQAVQRAIDYVHAGDVFQVNLSQRLLHAAVDDSLALYLRLRERNPATFAGYLDVGELQIVSASPERFLRVDGDRVEARPIKGTRPRRDRPEADLFAADDLQASIKDRAENVMIVDLLRNDLSRVCEDDSVHVSALCEVEAYQFVQHLVSVVHGKLRPDDTGLDLLRAAFPGGSITGAPKIRAMQIISELEPTARGAYCGSLGYLGFDGNMDWSILIRTITAGFGWWQIPVGGGIVAQSHPDSEYDETWHKAHGMLAALRS